jgi:hypothetical protein
VKPLVEKVNALATAGITAAAEWTRLTVRGLLAAGGRLRDTGDDIG